MVHPFRMIISGKGEEEDIKEQGVHSYLHIDEESKENTKEIELIWKTPRKSGWTQRVEKLFSIGQNRIQVQVNFSKTLSGDQSHKTNKNL